MVRLTSIDTVVIVHVVHTQWAYGNGRQQRKLHLLVVQRATDKDFTT